VAVEERPERLERAQEALVTRSVVSVARAAGSRREALGDAHEVRADALRSQANIVPVRPKPVATSSQIRTRPPRRTSRARRQIPGRLGVDPGCPCTIGSTITPRSRRGLVEQELHVVLVAGLRLEGLEQQR